MFLFLFLTKALRLFHLSLSWKIVLHIIRASTILQVTKILTLTSRCFSTCIVLDFLTLKKFEQFTSTGFQGYCLQAVQQWWRWLQCEAMMFVMVGLENEGGRWMMWMMWMMFGGREWEWGREVDDISGRGGFCSPLVREVGPTGRIPRYQVLPHREDATIPGSTTPRGCHDTLYTESKETSPSHFYFHDTCLARLPQRLILEL